MGGRNLYSPHGITITPTDVVLCVDDKDHTVGSSQPGVSCSGLGIAHQPSIQAMWREDPTSLASIQAGRRAPSPTPPKRHRPENGDSILRMGTGIARTPFSAAGELIQSWANPVIGRAVQRTSRVWIHTDGRVFVCDRENSRVQFQSDRRVPRGWTMSGARRTVHRQGQPRLHGQCVTARLESAIQPDRSWARPAFHVSIATWKGMSLPVWGSEPGEPGSFASAHGICIDSHGDIYIGENGKVALSAIGRYRTDYRSLKKLIRL